MGRAALHIVFSGHVVGLLLLGLSLVSAKATKAGAVMTSEGVWTIVKDQSTENLVAWGTFDNTISELGWAQLHVEASEGFDDGDQMFAAGYVEGYLTRDVILAFHQNTKGDHDELRESLNDFMTTQDKYLREEVAKPANKDDVFWMQVGLVLRQFDGLLKGYNDAMSEHPLTLQELWVINMDGDLIELETALGKGIDVINKPCGQEQTETEGSDSDLRFKHQDSSVSSATQTPALRWKKSLVNTLSQHAVTSEVGAGGSVLAPGLRFKANAQTAASATESRVLDSTVAQRQEELNAKFTRLMRRSRCTAVVKLTEDNSDILMAHNSWEDYVEMLRVYKHYQFHLSESAKMAAPRSSFSSYPGMLSSTDDFYMMSSGLAVIETTVNLMEDSLLEKMCAINGIASWVRSVVANRLATTGEEWADTYSKFNSGTYNCQWMITDYNLLKKANKDNKDGGGDLLPGTFWIVETVPGFSHKQDMTKELQARSYWPSANRPYFAETREVAGYPVNDNIPIGSTAHPEIVGPEKDVESDPIGQDMGLTGTINQKKAAPLPLLTCPEDCSDLVSFENNPRGAVLRNHAGSAWPKDGSMAHMKKLMRLNGWQAAGGDGMSYDPSVAVAARYDLLENGGAIATGAVDAKIVNAAGMESMTAQVIGGPTTQDHKAFDFDDWPEIKHSEMPSKWDFPWFEAKGFTAEGTEGETSADDDDDDASDDVSSSSRFSSHSDSSGRSSEDSLGLVLGESESESAGDIMGMGGKSPIVAEAVL